MSKCKSCGAEITWIKTENGKMHPINAKSQKLWVFHVDGQWRLSDCATSHFASCPNADQHRKPKDKGQELF